MLVRLKLLILIYLGHIIAVSIALSSFNTINGLDNPFHDEINRNFDILGNPKLSSYGLAYNTKKQSKIDDNIKDKNFMVVKTGTTIVGFCCEDGVVLGADTRTTGGSMVVNKEKQKVREISDNIYCCTAGTVADCDNIVLQARYDIFQQQINDNTIILHDTTESSLTKPSKYITIRSVLNSFRRSMLTSRNGESPQAVFILGGVDSRGYALHSITEHGVASKVPYCSLGSGSMKACSMIESEILHMNHTPDDFVDGYVDGVSLSSAINIVRKAVLSGIQNDLGSGSHIDIVTITKDGSKLWREELSYDDGVHAMKKQESSTVDSGSDVIMKLRNIIGKYDASLGKKLDFRYDDEYVDVEMVYEE